MWKSTFLALVLFYSFQSIAQTITIGNGGDYANLQAAESAISAGDTVVILNQTFTDGTQFLNNIKGTAAQPIVIIAETMHQAIFSGGTEGIHLINCAYFEINGLVFEGQSGNGMNVDDGGDYSTPSTNITVRNCIFRDITNPGNHDFLKMSGVDDFLIENCSFTSGVEGSGIDMVGCHNGIIQDCVIDDAGQSGIQCKGGTQFITIRRNRIMNITQRGINIGGNTGLEFFRPALSDPIMNAFEAADIYIYANIFSGNRAPVAYVGCVRADVINNTIYKPQNWVMRILQETTTAGFLPCSDNAFRNNITYVETDLTEVNIGPNTAPETFTMSNNLWFNATSTTWTPDLPVTDVNSIIANPLFTDPAVDDFTLQDNSPAIGLGLTGLGPMRDYVNNLFANPPSIGAIKGNPTNVGVQSANEAAFAVDLFPNPFEDHINLDFGQEVADYTITLMDVKGSKILQLEKVAATLIKLEIDGPPGIYFLSIAGEGGKEVRRLVKQ